MDQRQRIALQRQKAREALGLLRGISELFGTEDGAVGTPEDVRALEHWQDRVDELENWIFNESPIA